MHVRTVLRAKQEKLGCGVGALAALATSLLFGLAGIALGAHQLGAGQPGAPREPGLWTLIFSVFGAFLAFAVGGWAAATLGGFRRSEPAMLHGAIAWLVAVPLVLALAAIGAGSFFGGWIGGLAGTPAWAIAAQGAASPAQAAEAARNAALGAATALLLGLAGAIVGGWLASGEPMTLRYYRTRDSAARADTA